MASAPGPQLPRRSAQALNCSRSKRFATGGTLGGSQVGGRLTYNFSPALAGSLRSSSSVGGVRYAEVAAGVRWKPLAEIPVALNLERRFALNRWGGRNAFALFAEGGLIRRRYSASATSTFMTKAASLG